MCPGRLFGDAGNVLTGALGELVPPEAQTHLLNAQRELLLALSVTVEHLLRERAARSQAAATREQRRPRRVELD